LEADIAKCFDRINHDALLKKLNPSPRLRRQIRAWLQAGVMDNSNSRLRQKARKMGVEAREFLRFANLWACDRSRV
jgi:retron-type reverse transcriptase